MKWLKLRELLRKRLCTKEMANTLQISQPTISRDIHYLEKELSKSRKNYGQRLFATYEPTLLGYDELIKKLWSIIDSKNTEDKERIKAITLIEQYYR